MDIISQVCRHLTAQCLAHQTGKFELHSQPNRKPVQLTQHRRNVVTTSGSGNEACCGICSDSTLLMTYLCDEQRFTKFRYRNLII